MCAAGDHLPRSKDAYSLLHAYPAASSVSCPPVSNLTLLDARRRHGPGAPIKEPSSSVVPIKALASALSCQQAGPSNDDRHLCPSLVASEGLESLFTVRELISKDRQQISFSILDPNGTPVCFVMVNEKNDGANRSGIHVELLRRDMNATFGVNTSSKQPLAYIRTGMIHDGSGGLPEIHRPNGQMFCNVLLDGSDVSSSKRYIMQDQAGAQLVAFQGKFREKTITGTTASGELVCATERCHREMGKAPTVPYYTVKVASSADAGLLLCGLLVIDKLEGSTFVE